MPTSCPLTRTLKSQRTNRGSRLFSASLGSLVLWAPMLSAAGSLGASLKKVTQKVSTSPSHHVAATSSRMAAAPPLAFQIDLRQPSHAHAWASSPTPGNSHDTRPARRTRQVSHMANSQRQGVQWYLECRQIERSWSPNRFA
jgi:hypothetical protein